MGVDGHLDACLGNLLDHIVKELIVGDADEHLGPVAGCIVKGVVNLLLRPHVDRTEDVALYAILGAFGLECIHLLLGGVQGKPPVLDGEVLHVHALEIAESLVEIEVAIGVTGDADLHVIGAPVCGLGSDGSSRGRQNHDGGEDSKDFFHFISDLFMWSNILTKLYKLGTIPNRS